MRTKAAHVIARAQAVSSTLRTLVAVTCIAVLMAVGYWFWTDKTGLHSEARRAANQADREACFKAVDAYALTQSAEVKTTTDRCVEAGFISDQERRERLGSH